MYKNITNHYDPGKKRPKLVCFEKILHEPTKEWGFAHHPAIIWFKGRFYVMFSTGHVNEDDIGQVVRYTSSEDFEEWTEPELLYGPVQGEFREAVASPGGWYTDGETLVAYFHSFEYDESVLEDGHRANGNKGHRNRRNQYRTSTDGIHWSEPQDSSAIGGNHQPARLQSGRLLCCGSARHSYSDNPDGIPDWHLTTCFPDGYPNHIDFDNGEGVAVDTPAGVVSDTLVGLCEGSFVQTDDGTIYMYYRSGTPYLWVAESHDNAETWTLPQPTKFTDNRTKFHFGRLPSGKFYYVGTPDPFPPRTRHVLVLSLSDDGLDFNQHFILADTQYKGRFVGIDKNGVYGYPSTLVHDGYLYIVVSICKEKILGLRVPIDTL